MDNLHTKYVFLDNCIIYYVLVMCAEMALNQMAAPLCSIQFFFATDIMQDSMPTRGVQCNWNVVVRGYASPFSYKRHTQNSKGAYMGNIVSLRLT